MPYNKASQLEPEADRANGVRAAQDPKGLRNEALERPADGRLAQSVAALPLHGRGRGFESLTAHQAFKEIPLSRGLVALVSPQDYEAVSAHKWTAMPCGSTVYAKRVVRLPGGKRRTVLLHRVLMGEPAGLVDHRDGNGLDCRRHNLRCASYRQNSFNCRRQASKHGFVGVDTQTPGRFRGVVKVNGRKFYTKTFPSPVMAAAARDVLAQRLHGEFAVTNFRFIPVPSVTGA